jgi:hypothetical protein
MLFKILKSLALSNHDLKAPDECSIQNKSQLLVTSDKATPLSDWSNGNVKKRLLTHVFFTYKCKNCLCFGSIFQQIVLSKSETSTSALLRAKGTSTSVLKTFLCPRFSKCWRGSPYTYLACMLGYTNVYSKMYKAENRSTDVHSCTGCLDHQSTPPWDTVT